MMIVLVSGSAEVTGTYTHAVCATKVDVMYAANLAKFQQNAKLREALLSTKGSIKGHGFRFWVGVMHRPLANAAMPTCVHSRV